MNYTCLRILIPTVLFILLNGCGSKSEDEAETSLGQSADSYFLGFSTWPYDATQEAVDFVYNEISSKGNIISHHLDAGIPWDEALDETPYPAFVENELNARVANTPPDNLVYLTISPFNNSRDGLAGYWNNSGTGQTLSSPWDNRDFDSEEVIQAYTNFAKHAIERLNPSFFNLALEASELALNDATRFDRFVVFVERVSESLRAAYPSLQLMLSVALKSPSSVDAKTIYSQIPKIVPYIDMVGISIYPYIFFDHADKGNPYNLPEDWLSQIEIVSAGKPLAITETGWIAEPLVIPNFSVSVIADPNDQDAYVQILFDEAAKLDLQFIIWFSMVDYDALWNDALDQDDIARIWRDTGLIDENLNARAALTRWQRQLNKD